MYLGKKNIILQYVNEPMQGETLCVILSIRPKNVMLTVVHQKLAICVICVLCLISSIKRKKVEKKQCTTHRYTPEIPERAPS